MNSFFTVGVAHDNANEPFIFEKYLNSEINKDPSALRQFITILTKLALCNYNSQTGIIKKMNADHKHHLVLTSYVKDSLGQVVLSKIVELLNHLDRPCYEIRVNAEYEKKRIIFMVPMVLPNGDLHANKGYYLHFGFTKSNSTDRNEMNELTNKLANDSITMMKSIETHEFSSDIMSRWKVNRYQYNREGR